VDENLLGPCVGIAEFDRAPIGISRQHPLDLGKAAMAVVFDKELRKIREPTLRQNCRRRSPFSFQEKAGAFGLTRMIVDSTGPLIGYETRHSERASFIS
jgi:hypothetical protein